MKEKEKIQLTTQAGVPVADNQNILTAGERGPVAKCLVYGEVGAF